MGRRLAVGRDGPAVARGERHARVGQGVGDRLGCGGTGRTDHPRPHRIGTARVRGRHGDGVGGVSHHGLGDHGGGRGVGGTRPYRNTGQRGVQGSSVEAE